jgi:hypothetical protein
MKTRKLEKGEISVLVGFAFISTILFFLSLRMYLAKPVLSSQGAFPLIVTSLMIIMVVLMFIELKQYEKAFDNSISVWRKIKSTGTLIFPGKILHVLLMVLLYTMTMPLMGFAISTFLFLLITMFILSREKIKRIFLTSAGIVVAIVIIFQFVFKVNLP